MPSMLHGRRYPVGPVTLSSPDRSDAGGARNPHLRRGVRALQGRRDQPNQLPGCPIYQPVSNARPCDGRDFCDAAFDNKPRLPDLRRRPVKRATQLRRPAVSPWHTRLKKLLIAKLAFPALDVLIRIIMRVQVLVCLALLSASCAMAQRTRTTSADLREKCAVELLFRVPLQPGRVAALRQHDEAELGERG